MKLYNTLSRQIEEFKPLNPPKVTIYACGPTVYDYQHIGNFRTAIFNDILIRVLKALGYQPKTVRNITDIEDKIVKRASERGLTIEELTTEFTNHYFEDLTKLNIDPVEVSPKATEHITKMVKYIEELVDKDFAYVEADGSVYFAIAKFPDYGRLSQLDKRQLQTGTRMLSDEYTKDNIQDFALWKSVKANEVGWDSPWGRGRPGWHIECSAMSQEYLGNTLDIHTGGIDLLFPHHENEIAQSEAKTNQPFVRYFVHGEHLLIDNQKMSKSLKNIYRLQDLEDKGFEPLAFRYLTLTAHYRDKLNFTWDSLKAAQNALNNIRTQIRDWNKTDSEPGEYYQRFLEVASNDLNIPQALAIMHQMLSSDLPTNQKAAELLAMDQIIGLQLDQYLGHPLEIPAAVKKLIEEREQARQDHDFEKSDQLRHEIKKLGYEVKDTPNGPKLSKA